MNSRDKLDTVEMRYLKDRIEVRTPYSLAWVETARQRKGRWDRGRYCWSFRLSQESDIHGALQQVFGVDPEEVDER